MNGENQASCERNKLFSENLEFRPFSKEITMLFSTENILVYFCFSLSILKEKSMKNNMLFKENYFPMALERD